MPLSLTQVVELFELSQKLNNGEIGRALMKGHGFTSVKLFHLSFASVPLHAHGYGDCVWKTRSAWLGLQTLLLNCCFVATTNIPGHL